MSVRDLRPDLRRLLDDWQTVASFRDLAQPGWTRRPFTAEHGAAREWIANAMQSGGLDVRTDAAGNLIGRREGSQGLDAMVLGSHLDTVIGGGRFDGVLGVLAALEVARTISEANIRLRHPVEVVDMLAEEATDFGISMIGSRGMAGALDKQMLSLSDPRSGLTLAEAIRLSGGDSDTIADAIRSDIAVHLELHISQGPVLDHRKRVLGIVSRITGVTRARVNIVGRPDHAGGEPMHSRRDALTAAAELILAIEGLAQAMDDGTATIGRIRAEPNAANVVAGRVQLVLDLRSPDAAMLRRELGAIGEQLEQIVTRRSLSGSLMPISTEQPVAISEQLIQLLEAVAEDLGLLTRRVTSRAAHDATQLARVAPVAMIFVPSIDGRSHCPEESVTPDVIGDALSLLFAATLRLDAALP